MALPDPVIFGPLTRSDFVRYAGASGDFNPIHHDAEFARAAGLPDVMGQGMLTAGLVASAVELWFGSGAMLRFSVRFRLPVWPGDVLSVRCDGAQAAPGDRAVLALSVARGTGEIVLSGAATLRPAPSQDAT